MVPTGPPDPWPPATARDRAHLGRPLLLLPHSYHRHDHLHSAGDPLPNQANRDREVEFGPCSIGREYFSRDAADSEREAASVAK